MYEIFEHLMLEKGMTPYRVYKETGVAQSSLSDWKHGKGTPGADKLLKIADYFDVTVEYLLTGEQPTQQKELSAEAEGPKEDFTNMFFAAYGETPPEFNEDQMQDIANFAKFVAEQEEKKRKQQEETER